MACGSRTSGQELQNPRTSNLHYYLLKRLLVEKSIDVLAPSLEFINDLEEICINEPDLQFNIPKNMEESKVRFEYKSTFTAQSRRKQERQNEGHSGQEAFGNVDASDLRLRWYTVSELGEFFFELCRNEMQRNKSRVLESDTSFNRVCELLCELECRYERCRKVKEWGKLYTRLFAECKVAIPGLQHLMVDVNNVQAMTTMIRELAYSKLNKELSHVGFVSMTLDHRAAQFYKHKNGKQLCATRDVVMCRGPEGNEEKTTVYVIDRDLGNVAYSSWIKSVLDQETMCDLLGQTTNEDFLGDVVEVVLGLIEVMSYFQHELPLWRDVWKIK